jgi:PKD repeat protein
MYDAVGDATREYGGSEIVIFNPTDDSYVRGDYYGDDNFNSETKLQVKEGNGDLYDRHTYLRFDLSEVTGTVISAQLMLRCRNLPNGSPGAAFVYSVAEDNWSEETITWNNAPGAGSLLDSRTDINTEGADYTWDVTDFVVSEMAGDKIVSLMLKDDSAVNRAVFFHRREDTPAPILELELSDGTFYPLTVSKTGNGTVSSDPAGIECGSDCNQGFEHGTVVTLTAAPDANASFDGWSGGCSGTGLCVLTMITDTIVTATFTISAPPVANFYYDIPNLNDPLTIAFSDASTNLPTSWLWDFGDGYGSTEQNPTHSYSETGTYTVTLTANNGIGEDTHQKLVTVSDEWLSDHEFFPGDYSDAAVIGMSLPGTWRPFRPDSPWNTPIPTEAQTHPDSDAIIALAESEATNIRLTGWYNSSLWVVNSNNVPLVTDATGAYPFDTWDPDFDADRHIDVGIPITADTWPENTEDGHIVIVDPFKLLAWEMSRVSWNDYQNGGHLCSTFNIWDITGTGVGDAREGWRSGARGGRGSGFPVIAGMIRPEELEAGEIRHALVFTFDKNRQELHIPPASRTDGTYSGNQYPLEGMRFQLNPSLTESDFDEWGLSEHAKIVARALQKYGMFDGDNGGSMALQVQLLDQDSSQHRAEWDARFPNFYDTINNIPVNQFRVIQTDEPIDREEVSDTRVVAPLIKPVGREFSGQQQIEIVSATPNANITYTTDGTIPTPASTPYTGPFTIYSAMTIKAMAYRSGMLDSPVTRAPFTVPNAVLVGSVTLQGRPSAPNSRWVVPLRVSLTIPGEDTPAYQFEPITDQSGTFTITSDITPGTYEIRVKNSHTLQNKQTVTLTRGHNSIDFGELREGDANDDNYVTILDFSLLTSSFAKCEGDNDYNAQADFNGDGCVTILDFSLLVSNFGQAGQQRLVRSTDP